MSTLVNCTVAVLAKSQRSYLGLVRLHLNPRGWRGLEVGLGYKRTSSQCWINPNQTCLQFWLGKHMTCTTGERYEDLGSSRWHKHTGDEADHLSNSYLDSCRFSHLPGYTWVHERQIVLQFNLSFIIRFKGAWAICGFREHVMRLIGDACLESTKDEKKYYYFISDI